MIRIIDRTLTLPFTAGKSTARQLVTFCDYLALAGIQIIEIGLPAWRLLREEPDLPQNVRWMLRLDESATVPADDNLPEWFVRNGTALPSSARIQAEWSVNDLHEIPYLLQRGERVGGNIRIHGLPDLIRQDFRETFKLLLSQFGPTLVFSPDNQLDCASAMAVEWILAGGAYVVSSFTGIGGFASTESVLMGLHVIERRMPNMDLSFFPDMSRLFETLFNVRISDKAPVIGRRIFDVEAGIHADGLSKGALTYEPYRPAIVGNKHRLVIGKHSGLKSIRLKLHEHDIHVPESQLSELLAHAQARSMQIHRSLHTDEFIRLAKEVIQHEAQ